MRQAARPHSAWLPNYRSLVTCWECHIENFFAMVRLGGMKIMLRLFRDPSNKMRMLNRACIVLPLAVSLGIALRVPKPATCVDLRSVAGYEPRLKLLGSRLCVQHGTGYVLLQSYLPGLTGRGADAPNGWRVVVVAIRGDTLAVENVKSVHRVADNPFGLVCSPDAVYLNANNEMIAISPGLAIGQALDLPQTGVPYAVLGAASDGLVMTEAVYNREDVVSLFRKPSLDVVYRASFAAPLLSAWPATPVDIGSSHLGPATVATPSLLLAELHYRVHALRLGTDTQFKPLPVFTDKPPLYCHHWIVGVGDYSGALQLISDDYQTRRDWLIPGTYGLIDAVCVNDRFLIAYGAKYQKGLLHSYIPDSRLFQLDLETMKESVSSEKVGHRITQPLRHRRGGFAGIQSMDWDLGAVAYDPDRGDYLVTDGTRVCRVDPF